MGILNGHNSFDDSKLGELIRQLEDWGDIHESRMGTTFELLNAVVQFSPYTVPYRPGVTRRLGMVELLQVLSGYFDERHLAKAAPGLRYPYGLAHAYGIKIAQQLPKVIQQLRDNPETRRATLYIGKPEDGQEVEKPCMQAYQFHIRNNTLHTTVSARSWDAISGLPYDVMVAGGITQAIGMLTNSLPTSVTFFAASLHYYEEVWEDLHKRYAEKFSAKVAPIPPTFALPLFLSFDEMREWAMDELNDIDNWIHGLPNGVMVDV